MSRVDGQRDLDGGWDGNRRDQVGGEMEGESTGREKWNLGVGWEAFLEQARNLVQWKSSRLYEGNPS